MKTPLSFLTVLSFCIFFNSSTEAQTNVDSLKRIITSGNITDMIIFRNIGSSYARAGNFDSAVYYAKMGLEKSNEIKSQYWKTKYTLWIGGNYANMAQYDSAGKYLDAGFILANEIKNDSLIAQYYQNKGSVAQFQNDNDKAIEYLLKSVEVLERMGNKRPLNLLPHAYQDLSGIYNNTGLYEKAAEYDRKSLQVRNDVIDKGDLAKIYYNTAVTFNNLKKEDLFKLYLDSAAYTNIEGKNARIASGILAGYGLYYEHKNNLDSSLHYYQTALDQTRSTQDVYFLAERATATASILAKMKRYKEAQLLLEEAIKSATEFEDYQILTEAYKTKKEIAVQQGNFKEALNYNERMKQYSDSFTNVSTRQTMVSLEAKYENQKKQQEIATLKVQNTESELAIVKRNRLMIAGGIAAAALLLILVLLYRSSKQKQLLAEKEKEVQQQQIGFLEKQQQVVSMQSMINGQETERTRIAKDLHDGLGGLFSTVKMYFSTLQHDVPLLKDNELFQKSIDMVSTASSEVRRIAHNMMPEVLMKLGLINAVKDLGDHISAGKLLNVSLEVHGMNERLNASTEIMLYRIIQELLNNIIKHANASEAIIQFIKDDNRLSIVVEDNGRGFNSLTADEQAKAGIETIKSRVNYLNGKLTIDSQKDVGTTVMMDFLINS